MHFGEILVRCGAQRDVLELTPGASVWDAWSKVRELHPGLDGLPYGPMPAKNGHVCPWDEAVQDGDTVTFQNPVSCG